MAISGYPRGHNVKWVTRCQSTRGRISLTESSTMIVPHFQVLH
jgi:hypothetical protein